MAITAPLTPGTVTGTTSSSSTSVPYPTGGSITSSHLLIMVVGVKASAGTPNITTPSGWTLAQTLTLSTRRVGVYYRFAAGGESGSLSVSHDTCVGRSGGMYALLGVDPTTPIDVSPATGSSATLPSITTVTPGAWRVDVIFRDSNSSVTENANHNQRWDIQTAGQFSTNPVANFLADDEITAAGSTGTYPVTASGTLATVTFAVRPQQTIAASGVATLEAFGTTRLSKVVLASAIASLEAFGTAKINQSLTAQSIATGEAFGGPSVLPQPRTLLPSGVASAEAFGAVSIATLVSPSGIPSGEALGTPVLVLGPVTIAPAGIASGEAFGTAVVSVGASVLAASGIASLEAFGQALLAMQVAITGIASAEAFGSTLVAPGQLLLPSGIASLQALGTPVFLPQAVFLLPSPVASAEAFGVPSVQVGSMRIIVPSIQVGEVFGTPNVTPPILLLSYAVSEARAAARARLRLGSGRARVDRPGGGLVRGS